MRKTFASDAAVWHDFKEFLTVPRQCSTYFKSGQHRRSENRSQPKTKISLLHIMHYITCLSRLVSKETITNSFKHCGCWQHGASAAISTAKSTFAIEVEPGASQLPVAFEEYVNDDNNADIWNTALLNEVVKEETVPKADISDKESHAGSANVRVLTYAEMHQSFDSIWQFVAALERRLVWWDL